jgi:hypothetical protein
MKPPLGRPECLASWDRSITPSAPSSASFGLQREAHCAIAPNVRFENLTWGIALSIMFGHFLRPTDGGLKRRAQAPSRLAAGHRR